MCEPAKSNPLADAAAAVGEAVASVVAWTGRLAVRAGASPFSVGQLEHGRWVLTWRLPFELLAAAALVWWLGRPAAFVLAGVVAASYGLARALGGELTRRSQVEASEPLEEEPAEPVRLRRVS